MDVRTLSEHESAQVEAAQKRAGMPDLFSAPAQRHSETSKEAAESIKPLIGPLCQRVYDAIAEHGALTDEQITKVTGIPANTARPRRVELVEAGLIRAVGKSRTRSGRHATAWGAT